MCKNYLVNGLNKIMLTFLWKGDIMVRVISKYLVMQLLFLQVNAFYV